MGGGSTICSEIVDRGAGTLVAAGAGGCKDEPLVVDPDARPLDSRPFDAVDPDALDASAPPDTTKQDVVVDPDAAPGGGSGCRSTGRQAPQTLAARRPSTSSWTGGVILPRCRSRVPPISGSYDPPAVGLTAGGDPKDGVTVPGRGPLS